MGKEDGLVALFRHSNLDLADVLARVADLLEAQGANRFRVRAYRAGASTLHGLDRWAGEILLAEGREGLDRLPAIGKSLAAALEELLRTGRLRLLERLLGEVPPESLFTTVPGIGAELAHRVHEDLGLMTLEELELAAHDGRLAAVPGFGPRRIRMVRDALEAMLGRSARRRARLAPHQGKAAAGGPDRPPVGLLLLVDSTYRAQAEAGRLRTIAPRRFNPEGKAWLPVLHLEREGWALTAMYSNTARAHRLGRTRDWVVVFHEREGREGQSTVVTEHRGPLAGKRVVRGLEDACLRHYSQPAGKAV